MKRKSEKEKYGKGFYLCKFQKHFLERIQASGKRSGKIWKKIWNFLEKIWKIVFFMQYWANPKHFRKAPAMSNSIPDLFQIFFYFEKKLYQFLQILDFFPGIFSRSFPEAWMRPLKEPLICKVRLYEREVKINH